MPEISISLRDRYWEVLQELAREMDLSQDRVVEQGIAALQAIRAGLWTLKENHLRGPMDLNEADLGSGDVQKVPMGPNALATIKDGIVTEVKVTNPGPEWVFPGLTFKKD